MPHDLATFLGTLVVFAVFALPLALVGLLGSRRRR